MTRKHSPAAVIEAFDGILRAEMGGPLIHSVTFRQRQNDDETVLLVILGQCQKNGEWVDFSLHEICPAGMSEEQARLVVADALSAIG